MTERELKSLMDILSKMDKKDLECGIAKAKQVLNNKLQYALENSNINPIIEITYFLPDCKKKGGKYVEKIGQIKKVDNIEGFIIFKDKEKIRIDDVININGEIFKLEYYE